MYLQLLHRTILTNAPKYAYTSAAIRNFRRYPKTDLQKHFCHSFEVFYSLYNSYYINKPKTGDILWLHFLIRYFTTHH